MFRAAAVFVSLMLIYCSWTGASASPPAHAPDNRAPTASLTEVPRIGQRGDGFVVSLGGEDCVRFDAPSLGSASRPAVVVRDAGDGWLHVSLKWKCAQEVSQDELAVAFEVLFQPDFHWTPHLTPEPGYVIAQHVFRAPAMIAARGARTMVLIPDLDLVGRLPDNPWFMDLDAPADRCWIGMSKTDVEGHVGYVKKPGMKFAAGDVELAFYVAVYDDHGTPRNPWSKAAQFFWERYARPLYARGEPNRVPLDTYVQHAYNWAFNSLGDVMWQEFELDGKRVGGVKSHVNYTESPNYTGPWFQRKHKAIWNQAWFSSMRSASGLMRWASRAGDPELARKASLTKELVLAAPMNDGLFPSVIRVDNDQVTIEGQDYARPRPWSEAYWINSDRVPRGHGIDSRWYHLLDSSWTCLLMLRWYEEVERDPRLLDYARVYADKLLALQDEEGYFPGWVHPDTLQPTPFMAKTPETAMSVTFLLKLAELTDVKYRRPALRAMDALLVEVVPDGRWEDFETYGSCSRLGNPEHIGKKFFRNNMYKQNNFSMFWTAEALLESYRTTGDEKYLKWGRRTLDELSMTQQVWQPPFIYVPALGGFGVMNYDGEWNDSRQSLFAELFMRYHQVTGDARLFERGVAAIKAAFVMMYCPENLHAKKQYEKRMPFFGPEDYGFMMENYGHGGRTSPEGGGIGSFTIYDWGCGAASEGRNRIHDHFGDVYIDRKRRQGFGIDSIAVEAMDDGWVLTDLAATPRDVRVVFEDGTHQTVRLRERAQIP
ncbi:MAG TPA: hypothetical protein DD670_14105 [Planctomycetaceae bacterium]|nr:hypothetical protein [Planctomycetaceae bacterium]